MTSAAYPAFKDRFTWVLFALFWALCAPLAMLMPFHFCPPCRHQHCPLNLGKNANRSTQDLEKIR